MLATTVIKGDLRRECVKIVKKFQSNDRRLQKTALISINDRPYSSATKIFDSDVTHVEDERPRVLITGAMGQLGQGLGEMLRQKLGQANVIMSDIKKPAKTSWNNADPYIFVDILKMDSLHSTVVNYRIDWLINFSAILSALGEQNVRKAQKINVEGLHNVMEVARAHKLRVFVPSTIGAFGPSSPRINTPDLAIQRPKTIYGVSKVYAELLGEYYHSKFGTDFRCLRFPGVISADTTPGGGTTDYAVQIFHDAIKTGHHECYLNPDTRLPMMYVDDCLRSVVQFMKLPGEDLLSRCYNVTAFSFTPEELARAIRVRIPSFTVTYKNCPVRQAIADSWPQSLDDSGARRDWGWIAAYDLQAMVNRMLDLISSSTRKKTATKIHVAEVAGKKEGKKQQSMIAAAFQRENMTM